MKIKNSWECNAHGHHLSLLGGNLFSIVKRKDDRVVTAAVELTVAADSSGSRSAAKCSIIIQHLATLAAL